MATCQYCGTVKIAWEQVARKYVAFHAQLDATGEPIKKDVRDGARVVRRSVADTTKPHYPHAHHGSDAGKRTATECAVWTPVLAAARPKRGRRPFQRTVATPEIGVDNATAALVQALNAMMPPAGMPSAIPVAAPLETGSIGSGRATVAATGKRAVRMMEPEELMDAADLAAWKRAEGAIKCAILPTRVLLWGPPGTGKTELPWRIAQTEGWQHVYQLMTEETPGTEMTGHLIVQGGSTVWCDGTLGRAILASANGPVVYVIDEIGRASADAMSACLLALTNPESLRLTLRSGEVLTPNVTNWHCVATSNDEPNMLPPAVGDRLHIAVMVKAPHPDLVRSMTTMEARRLATATTRDFSVRALLTYDRLVAGGMTRVEAAGMVWEPDTASAFCDAARLAESRL